MPGSRGLAPRDACKFIQGILATIDFKFSVESIRNIYNRCQQQLGIQNDQINQIKSTKSSMKGKILFNTIRDARPT